MNSIASEESLTVLQKELETIKNTGTENEKTINDVYDALLVLEQR